MGSAHFFILSVGREMRSLYSEAKRTGKSPRLRKFWNRVYNQNMEKHIEKFILEATSKALATQGNHGINVMPVSTIRVVGKKIFG